MSGSLRLCPRRLARTAMAVLVAGVSIAAFAGCAAAAPAPSDTPVVSGSQAPEPTPTQAAEPTAQPTQAPWVAVDFTCDQVVTPQQLYDFNPNVGADPGYKPSSDPHVAMIVAGKGLTCGLMNQSSNATIEIAVGQPPENVLIAQQNDAVTNSHFVPTYGVPDGYFTVTDNIGEAQVFIGKYWLVMRSATFLEPGDAEPLMRAAIANLG